jgi:hypothetical protein
MVERYDNRDSAAPGSGQDTVESLGLDGIEIQMHQYNDTEAHYNNNGPIKREETKQQTGWERNTD